MKNKKIAIIGAGITGLSSGQILKDLGYDITIYEKNPYPGGLIACTNINGILFHKVGGHVFNTKNPSVSKWFWQKVDKTKFHQNKRNAKIYFKGMYLGYPIENNIYKFDEITIENIIDELLTIFCNEGEKKIPDNFDDFLRKKFGNTLYNLYFNPYNKKIWKTDLKNIPLKWLKGKLPMPDIKDIILNNIIKKEETQMVHSAFWYPEENGSQYIANTLAKELNIKYNSNIDKIKTKAINGLLMEIFMI
jgi:protoporphyrinogen oxidase